MLYYMIYKKKLILHVVIYWVEQKIATYYLLASISDGNKGQLFHSLNSGKRDPSASPEISVSYSNGI